MGDNGIMNIESTGKVMMISVILLLMVLLLVIALHLYVRWFWRRVELESYPAAVAVATPLSVAVTASGAELGLDLKVLGSLPVLVFRRDEFRDGLECAVCLCEVVDGEKARVLPRCGHGFHVECIDMWLQSHVTCPLCRKNVVIVDEELSRKDIVIVDVNGSRGSDQAVDGMQNSDLSPNFPTNVLFWGNETQVSSGSNNACLEDGNTPTSSSSSDGSSGMNSNGSRRHVGLDIDIPVQAGERSRLGSEETKSPVHARFRSLRRLLSRDRDRRVTPSIHGETEAAIDVEVGLRGQPC